MPERKQEEKYLPPKFESAVFFVQDVNKSKNFYANILGQKITMDFGRNVVFEGGFAIWEADYALNTIFPDKAGKVKVGGNNAEIYFESSNLEEVYQKLKNKEINLLHPIIEAPWGQKSFRAYDPDNHIIEFAEPMSAVVLRLHHEEISNFLFYYKVILNYWDRKTKHTSFIFPF